MEHGQDLLYSVIGRKNSFPTFHQVRTSYLSFHEAVQEALQSLGVGSRLFRSDEAKRALHTVDCFRGPVATDVLVEEKKIAGGAQWRRGDAFLHQGSIRLVKGTSFEAMKEALATAFERKFEIAWCPSLAEV